MTDDKLAEIEARLAAATSEPWELETLGGDVKKYGHYVYKGGWGAVAVCPKESPQFSIHHRNMSLIAHAPTDMRALLDEVKALRHDIARHVQITSDQAEEIDRLRGLELERVAVLKHLQALGQECDAGESSRAEQRKRGHYD